MTCGNSCHIDGCDCGYSIDQCVCCGAEAPMFADSRDPDLQLVDGDLVCARCRAGVADAAADRDDAIIADGLQRLASIGRAVAEAPEPEDATAPIPVETMRTVVRGGLR